MVTVFAIMGAMVASALVVGCGKAMHTPMVKVVKNPYSRKVDALRFMGVK